jgi:hypothetical protein
MNSCYMPEMLLKIVTFYGGKSNFRLMALKTEVVYSILYKRVFVDYGLQM